MKIISILTFLFVFAFGIPMHLNAALGPEEKTEKSPKKIKFFLKEEDYGFKEIISHVENAKKGDLVFAAQFLLSNKDYVNALKKASANGADVQLVVDGNNSASIQNALELQRNGVKAYVFNSHKKNSHLKTTGIMGATPTLFDGSANATYQAFNGNFETVYKATDPGMVQSALDDHKTLVSQSTPVEIFDNNFQPTSPKKSPIKLPLLETPKKPTRTSSMQHGIRETMKRRIENTTDQDLWITMYGIDQEDIKKTFFDKKQNIKMFCVDYHNLKNESTKNFLINLRKNNVPVYIFNADGKEKFAEKYPLINHQKVIVRGNLVMTGSENLTEKNSKDINQLTLLPDSDLAEQMKKQILEVAEKSTKIEDIPTLQDNFKDWYIQKTLERFEERTHFDRVNSTSLQRHNKFLTNQLNNIHKLGNNHPSYDSLLQLHNRIQKQVENGAAQNGIGKLD